MLNQPRKAIENFFHFSAKKGFTPRKLLYRKYTVMKNNATTTSEEAIKQAIKNGQDIKVNGRPVRIVGKNLFVEVRTRRGRGFSTLIREDLQNISL